MQEVTGNLWDYPADARVITTNGYVKSNGECVMGRGCAKEATERFLGIAKRLGGFIKQHGNHVFMLKVGPPALVNFPVKHKWDQPADISLIERSAHELVAWADAMRDHGVNKVVLPRPGCGNGRLNWERDVKPVLEKILDDRFKVITFEGTK